RGKEQRSRSRLRVRIGGAGHRAGNPRSPRLHVTRREQSVSARLASAGANATPSQSGWRRILGLPPVRIAAGIVATVALLFPAQLLASGASATTVRGVLVEVYTGL